MLRFMFTVAMA